MYTFCIIHAVSTVTGPFRVIDGFFSLACMLASDYGEIVEIFCGECGDRAVIIILCYCVVSAI